MKGTTLLELLISIGISSLLISVLGFLFVRSSFVYHGEDSRSEELHDVAQCMSTLSDKLSETRMDVLGPLVALQAQNGSSEITVEQFLGTYAVHQIITFAFEDNALVEKDYRPSAASIFLVKIQKPQSEEILARFIRQVRFRLNAPHTLEITLEGKSLSLQTEIPDVRVAGVAP